MDKEETQYWTKKHWNLVVETAISNYEGGVRDMRDTIAELPAHGPITLQDIYSAANTLCKVGFEEYYRNLWGPTIAHDAGGNL